MKKIEISCWFQFFFVYLLKKCSCVEIMKNVLKLIYKVDLKSEKVMVIKLKRYNKKGYRILNISKERI